MTRPTVETVSGWAIVGFTFAASFALVVLAATRIARYARAITEIWA